MKHLLAMTLRKTPLCAGTHTVFCTGQHNNPRFIAHRINRYWLLLSARAWAEYTGLRHSTILQRLRAGYSNEHALQSASLKLGNKNAAICKAPVNSI